MTSPWAIFNTFQNALQIVQAGDISQRSKQQERDVQQHVYVRADMRGEEVGEEGHRKRTVSGHVFHCICPLW